MAEDECVTALEVIVLGVCIEYALFDELHLLFTEGAAGGVEKDEMVELVGSVDIDVELVE